MNDLKLGRGTMSILVLVAAFLIAICVNKIVGFFSGARIDLTENNIHTLSKGTKNILDKMESPVKIRYYVTDTSDIMSPSELQSARRIKEKLDEFVSAAPSKRVEIANPDTGKFETKKVPMLTVEKLNPEPATEAEDSATVDGMRPVISMENNQMYMGLAIKCVDKTETIPYIRPQDEPSLEYKIISAISAVQGGSDAVVRLMTSLPVGGGMGANFQAPPKPKWAFYGLTEQKFKVEVLSPTVKTIPEDTNCLVVLHPYDISDDGQYAIDQYLLKGGNVIALVDPNFYYSKALAGGQQMPGMPPQQGPAPTSNLKKLFSAWGVKFDDTQVLADINFGSEIIRQGNFSPTFLTLNDEALDGVKDDIVTDRLNHLNMLTPGAFDITQKEGLKVDYLVQSSTQCQFVNSFDADPMQEGGAARIRQDFKASNIRMPLVARIRGNFKTAFPEGDPSAEAPAAAADEAEADKPKPSEPESLKESTTPGSVFLFADVDFLFDPICIDRQQTPFGDIVRSLNQNLTLLENAIAQSAGDPDLIDVRSRVETRRPLTRQNQWLNAAESRIQDEVDGFNQTRKDTEASLTQIMSQQPENVGDDIINSQLEEQISKLKKEISNVNMKVRNLQKESKLDFKRKQNNLKFLNTLMLPIILICAGIGLAVYRKTRTAAR